MLPTSRDFGSCFNLKSRKLVWLGKGKERTGKTKGRDEGRKEEKREYSSPQICRTTPPVCEL